MKKVILTSGGTGGHIYPALAVADELKNRKIEVLFIGTNHRMEKEVVPKAGYKFIGLDVVPVSIRKIKSVYKMLKATLKATKILKKEKPDAVIGFGNYISLPTLLSAFILRIPIYLQEQNVTLGMANKIFYKVAKKMFLAFDITYDELPLKYHSKLEVTGNPLRKEFYTLNYHEERRKIKLEEDEKIILIMGGSLGARSINEALIKEWKNFFDAKNIRVYWATGEKNYDEVMEKLPKYKRTDQIKPYFENMASIMCASDLVLCRSGALTISEIIELGKPSILVPYQVREVGQFENTKILSSNNASYVYTDDEAENAVRMALELINNDEELNKMRAVLERMKKGNSAEKIVEALEIWRN
ncbi:MAG: undecaprenyldiphospho-muramoylpentapeptide beta-N-acetylglucosaminyltransferase [Fusobacteria bacterium]|nr:MAG: undecaprenyldiphospho-muramoylpentapeptide beta-N-acetylglucosaminyltransferase [Fusobacteriota bacterium]